MPVQNPENTEEGRTVLSELDFYDYNDTVARGIHDWYTAGEQWNDQIHRAMYIAAGRGRDKANNKIIHSRQQYVRTFEAAAKLIVTDSPIEERAVSALKGAIRDEEARRLEVIDTWYKTFKVTPATDEYVRDLTLAFADPAGRTLMPDSDELVLSHQAATELFEARLRENEYAILGCNLEEVPDTTASTIGLGAIAIGTAWLVARGLKAWRKRG